MYDFSTLKSTTNLRYRVVNLRHRFVKLYNRALKLYSRYIFSLRQTTNLDLVDTTARELNFRRTFELLRSLLQAKSS
jgi:hypothetical protein